MKVLLFASLLVCLLAVSPLDKLNAVARQDDCASKVFDLVKPELDQKLEELKNVLFLRFRTKTSTSSLKCLPLWRKERPCSTNARPTSPLSRSETPSNGKELPCSSPPTASRTSELSSSSPTPSSNPPRTTPTTSLLPSSDTSSADKPSEIAPNSSTSSSDPFNVNLKTFYYLFQQNCLSWH